MSDAGIASEACRPPSLWANLARYMGDSPESEDVMGTMYKVMLERLVDAALDQPQPTPMLTRVLNDALRLLQHPLAQPKVRM